MDASFAFPHNVFPAYAGMIPAELPPPYMLVGVPRIRGDDPYLVCTKELCDECSPHTRG